MEGVTDRQGAGSNTLRGAVVTDWFEFVGIPGDNNRRGAVDRGDGYLGVIREQCLNRGFVGLDGES